MMEAPTADSAHERLANPELDPLEQELSTIRTIYARLKAMQPEARVRVWKYVSEVLGDED